MPRKESESRIGSLLFMDDKALMTIANYLENKHANKECLYFKRQFAHDSYLAWAASELVTRILDKPYESAYAILEGFRCEMAMYANAAPNKHSLIFETAAELSEEILELLN